jgi:hypothetical protein
MTPPLCPIRSTSCILDLNGTHAVCTKPVDAVLQKTSATLMHAGRIFANDMETYVESAHAAWKHGQGGDALGLHVVLINGHWKVGANPGRFVSANGDASVCTQTLGGPSLALLDLLYILSQVVLSEPL